MRALSWLREPRWRVATFLAVASGLNYADRAAMSSVLTAVRDEFRVSDISLSLLGSFFLWSYALGSPLAGGLADRFSRTKLIVWSIFAWSVVTALMGAVTGFTLLLVLRFCLGVAECLFLPAAIALIADYHSHATRARALSMISIGVNIGLVLGGTFSGFMAERFGWRSGFWILGLAGIGLAWLAKPMLAPPPTGVAGTPVRPAAPRASFADAVRYLTRVPSYYALLLESMLSGTGLWIFFNWLPLYFRDTYKMSLAGAGFAGTFMLQISVILGIAAGGWISDRVAGQAPQRRMLLYGLFYLVAAPFLLLFLGRPEFVIVAAGISAFSFLRGLGQANDTAIQCEIVPAQFRSTGVGIMNAVATAAGGCGVLMTGFLKRSIGLDGIFAGISVGFVIAGVILLTCHRFFVRADIARAQAAAAGVPLAAVVA
jgi:MFS transporter, Spinster family, sphingosine-1-phosphate transporter